MPAGIHLVADIGGTNARFAIADPVSIVGEPVVLKCDEYQSLDAAYEHAVAMLGQEHVVRACFGVAAPVLGDEVAITNGSWSFSVSDLRKRLGLQELVVVNDLAAQSLGLLGLHDTMLKQVGSGTPSPGACQALIGAGTGLGVSCVVESGSSMPIVMAGEGGYIGLPIQKEREIALWHALRKQYGRVSAERVLSGSGLVEVCKTLSDLDGLTPVELTSQEIVLDAERNPTSLSREAVDLFLALLGDVAGNIALTVGALGGVFLSGNLLVNLRNMIDQSQFRARFEDKGRGRPFVSRIPSYLVLDSHIALRGTIKLLNAYANSDDKPVIGYAA